LPKKVLKLFLAFLVALSCQYTIPFLGILISGIYWFVMSRERLMLLMAMPGLLTRPAFVWLLQVPEPPIW
jgi:hypothetical protein